jgi:hypothetical protein
MMQHIADEAEHIYLALGASSEKTPKIYGQCFIFDELIDENSDKAENKVVNIKENKGH